MDADQGLENDPNAERWLPPAVEASGVEQTPRFDSRAASGQASDTLAAFKNRVGRRCASPSACIVVRRFDIGLRPAEWFGIGARVLDPGAALVVRELVPGLAAMAQSAPIPVKRAPGNMKSPSVEITQSPI